MTLREDVDMAFAILERGIAKSLSSRASEVRSALALLRREMEQDADTIARWKIVAREAEDKLEQMAHADATAELILVCGHTMADWVIEDELSGRGHCGRCIHEPPAGKMLSQNELAWELFRAEIPLTHDECDKVARFVLSHAQGWKL